MERVLGLLKENGRTGMIVPNTWVSIDSCEELRKKYFGELKTEELIFTYQIFKDVSDSNAPIVDTVIFIAENSPPEAKHKIAVLELDEATHIDARLEQLKSESWSRSYHEQSESRQVPRNNTR
jgi:hypothetical protein